MNEPSIQSISTISYIIVERIMGYFDQKMTRTVHQIHLFPHTISTADQLFPLENVHDLSYRPFSGGTGLFYLHTNQGVFTYEIDTNPTHFIQAYKKLRG